MDMLLTVLVLALQEGRPIRLPTQPSSQLICPNRPAKWAKERIRRRCRDAGSEATEVIGLRLAHPTSRLRRRYGIPADVEGVVVLAAAERLGPSLGMSNLREGDVVLGIGPPDRYGDEVEPARLPTEMLALILKYDQGGKEENREWRLAGYRYRCGPLHPSEAGQTRQWRMELTVAQWEAVEKAAAAPTIWKP